MKRLFLLLFLAAAAPSFACEVGSFTFEHERVYSDERVEAVMTGTCGSTAVPLRPLVRVEGTTVTIDLADGGGGLTIPAPWGERVRLPRLFPGQYTVVVRIGGEEKARRTLAVHDRPFRITPEFGEPGQKVLIEGIPVGQVCPLIHCAFFAVFFGGVEAETEEIGDQQVVATVPPGSGRVDVRVELRFGDPLTLPGGFNYGMPAQNDWERVLFPVNFIGGGAHGSQWVTDSRMHNDGVVEVATVPNIWIDPASPILPIPLPFIPPQGRARFTMRQRDGGEFLYVPRRLDAPLRYTAHIVDLSRSTTDLGAEMPLVRAEDTANTIRLLEVPVESRYRARLRVYDYDLVNGREVLVVVRTKEGTALHTRWLTLTVASSCDTVSPCLSERPAFAVLDLDQIPELRGAEVVDVTLKSRTNEGRIWGFVSVTNNDTQAVTLYSPQHRTRAQ
ncbi:MAG TPA: hypothetical protein VGF28_01735 [Thermoanaerobaculia bacterium]|jgi:hypothetical protein